MTYQEFAKLNCCSIQDVVMLCESGSGCTHYSVANDRYLILYNASFADNNVSGRIRWTKAHELGHVALKHLPYIAVSQIAEHNFSNVYDRELEKEADYFASMLLSPFPVWEELNILSVPDIQCFFGLSEEASKNRMSDYIKWKRSRIKTAWENDIKRLILGRI
jgi:Zn-dependent peptidase ImmA (M78 family)